MILMIKISNTVTDWFHESFVFESRRSGETPRRGGQLRDSDERLRIASNHLASHATNESSPADVNTDASEHGGKKTDATTNKREFPSPSRITRKTRTQSVVCAVAENEDTAPTNLPHRHRSRLFPLAKTFSDRRRDGGRLFRRREKTEMRLLTSKLNLRISHTVKPCP